MTMTKEVRQEIAGTILNQLGGSNRLGVMIGAKNFSCGENGELTFMFKMFKKANILTVKLNGLDLYDLSFKKYNQRSLQVSEVETMENIYAEDLKQVFENYTGLYLTL